MAQPHPLDPSLLIPAPPLRCPSARACFPPGTGRRVVEAVREASLVGTVALAASWGLAELALLLLGTGPG